MVRLDLAEAVTYVFQQPAIKGLVVVRHCDLGGRYHARFGTADDRIVEFAQEAKHAVYRGFE